MRLPRSLCLLLLVACANPSGLPAGTRTLPPGELTPAYQGMRSKLVEAQRLQAAGDTAGLRTLAPEISEYGLNLLSSTPPHDVRNADMPRFVEGRAAFGDALKRWVSAAGSPDDEALGPALQELVDTYWGWVDACKGLPPEHSI